MAFPFSLQDMPPVSRRYAALYAVVERVDWIALALAMAAFAVYVRTLAPSVLWSDEAEFQYSAYHLSVPHQTGYPLYIMLGKLWTFLPVGDIAYRVNLMSACWGAVTVMLTYLCVKQLSGLRWAAAVSALSLAFGSAFWMQASIAGVRTLHTAFVALITWLVIGIVQRRASVEALALVIGLALTHHRMTIFLLPGVAWVLWQTRSQVQWSLKRWVTVAAMVALPQTLYLFVALGYSWSSPREFWDFVLTSGEASDILTKTSAHITAQFGGQVMPSVWNAFTPVGLFIALIGLGALILGGRRNPARFASSIGVYLAVGWALNIAFAGLHSTEDPNKYLTHGFVLEAVAIGAGLAVIITWLERQASGRWKRGLAWAAWALPAALMALNWRAADQSGTGWIGPFTLDELASVESNSTVIADWSFVMSYRYHQIVEGHRRDLVLLDSGNAREMNRTESDIKSGRPVYVRERFQGKRWKGQLPLVPVGRFWRVLPAPPTFDAPQHLNEPFGEDLKLTQIAAWPSRLTADQLVLLRLGWELLRPLEHDLTVSVRLVDGDGVIWMHQETPLQDSTGVLSTTAWVMGPALPPGDYHWQVTVDNMSMGTNLGLADLPTFHIDRPDHPVPLSSLVVEGRPAVQPGLEAWELVGYASVIRNAQPGALVTASLFWRATRHVSSPVEARLQLRDRQGSIIAEQTVMLPQEARAGDLVESRPGLVLPVHQSDGRYEFFVVGDNAVSLGELNVRGRARNYKVPSMAHHRQVQLGEGIELLGYELNASARPGDQVSLTLIWRAKNAISQSFKVFVHVVDASGKLLVQKDGVPGNWAVPTDTWAAGEVIIDAYSIPIPPETAPGDYRVQVGMYDPETGQRLPAYEAGSRLADDIISAAQFTIP